MARKGYDARYPLYLHVHPTIAGAYVKSTGALHNVTSEHIEHLIEEGFYKAYTSQEGLTILFRVKTTTVCDREITDVFEDED